MSLISLVFNEVLYRPLFNGLIFLYNVLPWHDFGIAIILLTVFIRLILYPLNQKSIKSQKALSELQPKIKEVQEKFKGERTKQSQALLELYRAHKINPASGCLPLLLQLPILIALYQVFWKGLDPGQLDNLYSFVTRPEAINPMFLGLINLAKSNYWLAILAGAFTFVQSKMMMGVQSKSAGSSDFSSLMSKQLTYFMPVMTVIIAWRLPAGLALYWIVITLFGIGQQYLVMRKKNDTAKEKPA